MMSRTQKLTMTLMDVYHAMRDAGIPSSPERISAGIASGAYPFGEVINVGETGRRTLLIYRVDFEAWLETKMPKQQESKTPKKQWLGANSLCLVNHAM